jgi:hypothetical protein
MLGSNVSTSNERLDGIENEVYVLFLSEGAVTVYIAGMFRCGNLTLLVAVFQKHLAMSPYPGTIMDGCWVSGFGSSGFDMAG